MGGEENLFPKSLVVGRINLPVSAGLRAQLLPDCRLPSGPKAACSLFLHGPLHRQLITWQFASSQPTGEALSPLYGTVFYNKHNQAVTFYHLSHVTHLIKELTSPHLCRGILARGKSQVPFAFNEGWGLIIQEYYSLESP